MSLVDLPLIRRLTGSGTILDSEIGLTRDARAPESLLLSSLFFPRGLYTLVAHSDVRPVMGQFRYRPDDVTAHVVYLAPELKTGCDDTAWLHMLDAMSREAGKHGAHALVAEAEPTCRLFETLRAARFATYARQTLWRHAPFTDALPASPVTLTDDTSNDQMGIMALIASTVPPIVQQVAAPHSDMDGLVYRRNGRIEGYIGVADGPLGVYLLPYLHPDLYDDAGDILRAAIARVERSARVPVYVCVRSYHGWLNNIMPDEGFDSWTEQAVMVRQIAAGIRHTEFSRVRVSGQTATCNGTWSTTATSDTDT
jgi:hypothetical protein